MRNFLDLANLAMIRSRVPTNKSTAAKICAYSYPPFFSCIKTPPIGGPVNTAKLTTVNTMPILTPAFRKSGVRLLNVAGNRP